MTKFELWRQFLIQNQTTAFNVFVIAGVVLLFWAIGVKGKKWENWLNWLSVGGFWLLIVGWALFSLS